MTRNTKHTTYKPGNDGVDHINIYGQGKTQLGRELSNFARTPFRLKSDGAFESVEGWWYWQSLRSYAVAPPEILREAYGFEAKKKGREIHSNLRMATIAPSRAVLAAVYHQKARDNPGLRERLVVSALPFDHYYVYSGQAVSTRWR